MDFHLPWVVTETDEGGAKSYFIDAGDGRFIAEMYDFDNAEAYARLIVDRVNDWDAMVKDRDDMIKDRDNALKIAAMNHEQWQRAEARLLEAIAVLERYIPATQDMTSTYISERLEGAADELVAIRVGAGKNAKS